MAGCEIIRASAIRYKVPHKMQVVYYIRQRMGGQRSWVRDEVWHGLVLSGRKWDATLLRLVRGQNGLDAVRCQV